MRISITKQALVIIWICFAFFSSASASDRSTEPKLNNGARWRIGYYEGGEYINYQKNLITTLKGLMELGWIEPCEIPQQKGIQTRELWEWLETKAKSKYLRFVSDFHYSAKWDAAIRKKMTSEIIGRLNRKDIDLMFIMGTWAGQDIANNKHKTPAMLMSCSDPVAAGIIKSVDDSGYEHLHVRVDPFRHERQIRVFYDIIKFKKLGVAYKNTVDGRSYAAISTIKKLAKERGFELIPCHIKSGMEPKADEENVKACFRTLAKKADAIYVTLQSGINKNTVPELVKIVNSQRIPTFSQAGPDEVKKGFLMTITFVDFNRVGKFYAETAAKILNGAKPRQLPMYCNQIYKWHVNFETAEKIGLNISELNLESDCLNFPDFLSDESQ
ncbi:ABC transporter substrate-binding protein [Desulfonema magnum]|uniref:ABC transporter, substrate-binding protein n=1 Tax=Desulfonema magnum TaxID=45655 RepID=A0A975GR37_9BACT|nr:ABC transporter substrate binding protein [Desulfonema magnum]QTA89623.1 putative ABC transporter, substrate-binding protein [Desulfonema magnum]